MTITDNSIGNNFPKTDYVPMRRSADYVSWREEVAAELQSRSHFDEAERWDYCDNSPRYRINRNKPELPPSAETVWVCSRSSEHDAVLFSPSCDYRICPDCARRHTARLMSRFIPAIEKLMASHPRYRLRTLMLTTKVRLGSEGFREAAQHGFELIQKAMRIVCGPNWNKNGRGMLANWEVGPKGNLLHYHGVYLGDWVDQKKLSKAWHKLTGDAYYVWVGQVKHNDGDWQGAISEVLKYATKFYSEDKTTGERIYLSPALTVDLFEALKGTRRIRAWGSLYNIGEPLERMFCCSQCDSKMVRITLGYYEMWRLQGFNDVVWRQAIRLSLLQYRTADKLGDNRAETNIHDPPRTKELPFLDEMPVRGQTHYDYE